MEEFPAEPSTMQWPTPQRPVLTSQDSTSCLLQIRISVQWGWTTGPDKPKLGVGEVKRAFYAPSSTALQGHKPSGAQSTSPLYFGQYPFKSISLGQSVPNGSPPNLGSSHCQPTVYCRVKSSCHFSWSPTCDDESRIFLQINLKVSSLFPKCHNDYVLDL